MDTLLGRYLTPTVILTDSAAEARAIAATLREAAQRPPLAALIASIRTFDDVRAARPGRQGAPRSRPSGAS